MNSGRQEQGAIDGFGLAHLPYGVFSRDGEAPRVGVRYQDRVLDLGRAGMDQDGELDEPDLGGVLARGPRYWDQLRAQITDALTHRSARTEDALLPLGTVRMHLPFTVADYVDFYSSEHHARNVSEIFRPGQDPLPASWKHLPIGYHGRSGSVVVSGTDVVRPCGQRRGEPSTGPGPVFGPSTRLDVEAELGFVVGTGTAMGTSVGVSAADEHLFGVALVNDWSARDIQAWEYVPLGPMLGKSFATSIGAWITPMAALREARCPLPEQQPQPLPYLRPQVGGAPLWGLDIEMELRCNGTLLARPPFRQMYWGPAQQLAHLTVNGAPLRTGDLFASGTVSGPESDQVGSLLELTNNGTEPIGLDDGTSMGFLRDGDRISITATAAATDGGRLRLGEVVGTVLSARVPGGLGT